MEESRRIPVGIPDKKKTWRNPTGIPAGYPRKIPERAPEQFLEESRKNLGKTPGGIPEEFLEEFRRNYWRNFQRNPGRNCGAILEESHYLCGIFGGTSEDSLNEYLGESLKNF